MGRKARTKSSLQKDENQTYKNDEQFYKKLIIVRDKFILFYNEEIEKNIPSEDERKYMYSRITYIKNRQI